MQYFGCDYILLTVLFIDMHIYGRSVMLPFYLNIITVVKILYKLELAQLSLLHH